MSNNKVDTLTAALLDNDPELLRFALAPLFCTKSDFLHAITDFISQGPASIIWNFMNDSSLLDINDCVFQDSEGDAASILMVACARGHLEIVELLLNIPEINVNVHSPEFNWSALMYACKKGHLRVVQRLLEVDGLDVNHIAKGDGGECALTLSIDRPHIVEALLEKNVEVNTLNANGYSALMLAVMTCCEASIYMLLQQSDINVDVLSPQSFTAEDMCQHSQLRKLFHTRDF